MKTAIICYICKKPKRESDSYALKIADYSRVDPETQLSPEQFERLLNSPHLQDWAKEQLKISKDRKFPQIKVRACRTCTKRMGYKIKAKVVKPKL